MSDLEQKSTSKMLTSIPADRSNLTINLRSFLDQLNDEEVLFYPTPGNAGDSVIQVGIYQAFGRAGVRFKPINLEADVVGRTLILGGGANLTPLYRELRYALLDVRLLERCERLIILSHTIRGNEDLLRMMGDKVTIFCRDPESYIHVLRHASTKNVHLDHDMALHIDVDQFYRECRPYTDVPSLFNGKLANVGRVFPPESTSFEQRRFFRTDGEKLPGLVQEDNLDLSTLFEFGTWPENSYKATWCFFEALRRSGQVLTDRLHVGIAASLLGKSCKFYDNSYGKNRTVYTHSIRKYVEPLLFEFMTS